MIEKPLNKKAKVNFNIYDVTVITHILPNISRSRGNQTMKFGQLIENNIRNIFLEKPYVKCGGEASSRPFYKESKLRKRGLSKYMNIKVLTTCFYLI